MIFINNICLSFSTKTIFDGINWTIMEKSRVGLVGDNGTGKTTLLRAIMGQVELDQGAIDISGRRNRTIGYLPQDLVELEPLPLIDYLKSRCGVSELEQTLRQYEETISRFGNGKQECDELLKAYEKAMAEFNAIEGYRFDARAKQVLNGIGFRDLEFSKRCTEFSGGWKMRILLAVILLNRPDIMLLDEPTNHLDTESMEWLENYLKDYQGTLITIAHDRVFLDKIVTQIAELAARSITIYKGNYSFYLKEKERRIEALKKEMALQRSEIKRTQDFIERFRYKSTKAKQVQSRMKVLERFEVIREDESAKTVHIRFPECPKSGKEVAVVQGVSKAYGGPSVFDRLDFAIHRGEKIAVVGINGSGKSTLARVLGQVEEPTSGMVRYGLNVQMAFFSQESAQNLQYENTVWEDVCGISVKGDDQDKRNLLGAFLFSGDDIHKPVSVLSGGEKSRLALLKILLTDANFLILDEPTNHLDLRTKDIFQNALLNYQGTVLIVSHDRYFLDRLVHRVIEMKEGHLYDYPGNYSYFIEKRQAMMEQKIPGALSEQGEPSPGSKNLVYRKKEDKRLAAEERNRLSRIRRTVENEIRTVEQEVAQNETRKTDIERLLCSPEILRDGQRIKALNIELKNLEHELENLYGRWNDLAVKMGAITNG